MVSRFLSRWLVTKQFFVPAIFASSTYAFPSNSNIKCEFSYRNPIPIILHSLLFCFKAWLNKTFALEIKLNEGLEGK
jgi:hypothetical protein